MQTFLPYADFDASMRVLDSKRLQKQAVETYQILLALLNLGPVRDGAGVTVEFERRVARGWVNHPMTRMWRGYEYALLNYQTATCNELFDRPTKSGKPRSIVVGPLSVRAVVTAHEAVDPSWGKLPPWLGDERLHSSHRANLKRKDPVYYGQFDWVEAPQDGYFWPDPTDYVQSTENLVVSSL